MTIFEENLIVLKNTHADLYECIIHRTPSVSTVMVGDAYDGERFLALEYGQEAIALNSMYHPQHAAERYAAQFMELPESTTLLLFGLGDGQVVRRVLSDQCPVRVCIVYEPSVDILIAVLEQYDLRDILASSDLELIVQGMNEQMAETILQSRVNYMNWKTFAIISMPVYDHVFPEELQVCYEWYHSCLLVGKGSMTTVIDFAKSGLRNGIKAQKWMIESYAADQLVGRFPEDIPCIVVAGGPSLKKNVQYLREAKGKACIIAVDSVLKYLLDQGIVPDYTCTVDAEKSAVYFEDDRLKGIPVFLSTISSSPMLETLKEFRPIYFMNTISYYDILMKKSGHSFLSFDGGGSVATVVFRLALELQFHTIIIVGQDLAYTNMESHAGTGKVTEDELMRYTMYDVEGYYGDVVSAPGDFKLYIDWYRRIIPMYADTHTIINATEGGAKLQGAIQLPLKDAIDRYCTGSIDCEAMIADLPKLWGTKEKKQEYYLYLRQGFQILKNMNRLIKEGIANVDRALTLARRGSYSEKEFSSIENKVNHILNEIMSYDLYEMMLERAAASNIDMADGLDENKDDSNEERIYLYQMIHEHMKEVGLALEEAIPMWEESIKDLEKMVDDLDHS